MQVSMKRFEGAVQSAIDAIPPDFQLYLDEIEFLVAERSPQGLLGLYDGPGALETGGYPARVTVFKASHEAVAETWEDLVEEVRRTVLHEVGHHFLMEEGDLPY
jgi:predicted Zn-dependent protease with MMP-like domain